MKRKLMLLMTCLMIGIGLVNAQVKKVTGTVTSEEDGLPVVGASVLVKGTTVGTVTDIDGNFTISNVPSSAGTLVVSFIGLQTQEVKIQPVMKIMMQSNAHELDEVMVVAFGTAKKSQFTGSASTIKADKIVTRQTSNVTNALSGQVAGVQITSSNGEPGSKATVRIRGIGSMSASNEPLYVVDGVPFDGGIETINPQDIETMTVLKDAASNALYGARGANGVILITTKKGQVGSKARVDVDAKWGTNRRAIPNYDVMTDPNMYYETYYQAVINAMGGSDAASVGAFLQDAFSYPIYTVPEGQNLFTEDGKINPNATLGSIYQDAYYVKPDNWYDELFDKGNLRQEYNVRVSGASQKSTYYLSAGYLDDSGIIPNSGFQRFTLRTNADYQINDRIKVGTNLSYSNSVNKTPRDQEGSSSSNLFYVSNMIAPIYPLYVRDAQGNIMTDSHGFTMYDFGAGEYPGLSRQFMGNSNPASMLALDKQEYNYDVFSGRAFVNIDIYKGLKATANWGVDLDNTRFTNLYNAYYGQYSTTGGIIYVGATRTFSINQQYLLTYANTFGEHNIDVLAGFESYKYKYNYLRGSKENLYNPNVTEIDNAIANPQVNSYTDNYATQGILARLQYNYANKYFLSASYRRDASSRFAPENRWGNFWSVGGGWLMNKESFLQDAHWIDMLKYKISYGVQGNDNLNLSGSHNYNYYSDHFNIADAGGDFALSMSYKGNRDITWETSHSFNTGFDFEFFTGRLGGTVEYFQRKTTDMLYNRPVATSIGYSSFPMNVGSMMNRGFEMDIYGDMIRTKHVTWSANFNLTYFKNKILKLHPDLNGEMISGSYIYREGESSYQMYLRKYAGVDPETGEALYWTDVTDDKGNVTGQEKIANAPNATRYATGDILPKVYGGFGTTLNAYGFDLSIALSYQLGGRIYDNTYASLMHAGGSYDVGHNWHKDILNAWTPDNKNTDIPRLNYTDQYANYLSDRFLTSSDYLSINNITFGYTLPKNLTTKFGVSNLRLYMAVDNVAVISARKGLDPRQSYSTSENSNYSPIRSISGGISLSF